MTQVEFLPLLNSFYLGAYSKVQTDASTFPADPQQTSRQLTLKSLIAQGKYDDVINAVPQSSSGALLSLKLVAQFLKSRNPSLIDEMASVVDANPDDSNIATNAASLFYLVGDYERALLLLVKYPKDIECVALIVQIYLKIDRVDMALKELEKLKSWADDATLAQLIESWGGEEKYKEAAYVFEELASSKLSTSKMLNGHAVCLINMLKFEEADKILQKAHQQDPTDADVLTNMIVVNQALGRFEVAQQLIMTLGQTNPAHEYIQSLASINSAFDNCSAQYKFST